MHDKDTAFTHIVAEVGGKPMGYCRYKACGGYYHGETWVDVSPDFNEFDMDYLIGELEYIPPGFGRVMMDRMLDMLHKQGATAVAVTPEENDKAACQFLESCYFQWDGGFYTHFL